MLYALLLPFFRDSERKPFSAEISEHEEISVRNNLDIGAINFGCGSEPKGGSSLRNLGSIEARSLGWRYAFHVWPDHRLRSLPRRVVAHCERFRSIAPRRSSSSWATRIGARAR